MRGVLRDLDLGGRLFPARNLDYGTVLRAQYSSTVPER